MNQKKPFFYDVTLRDGNQALKKPWNTAEKEIIFKQLLKLGVQGIEVGFSGASDMDFEACAHLAKLAPDDVVISGLARAVKFDIDKVAEAIKDAPKPRIHTFIAMNPLGLEYVLKKPLSEVKKIAVDAVAYAKSVLPEHGEVQFSVEHFGDCKENLDEVIDALQDIVKAGATILNLPNTVERTRPMEYVQMIEKVAKAMPDDVVISVHCHNDLGMATAATVESYFAGATQLECSLNGLGERAGNTNMYEVAIGLHNSGVEVPLNLDKIYETALVVSEMSDVPVFEKSPLIGADALAHRSGIHQDGAMKTKNLEKGAYRPINPSLIGRGGEETLGFTSQSGKTALYEIVSKTGYPITMQEAIRITPVAKATAEKVGELSIDKIKDIYESEILNVEGPFKLVNFNKIEEGKFNLEFTYDGKNFDMLGHGNGPLDSCLDALRQAGFEQDLLHYEQIALQEEKGVKADAMTVIELGDEQNPILCRGLDESTAKANVKAIFNGLNLQHGLQKK